MHALLWLYKTPTASVFIPGSTSKGLTRESRDVPGRWVLLYTSSGGASSRSSGSSTSSEDGGGSGGLASALPFLQAVSDSAYQFFYRWGRHRHIIVAL